MTGVFVVSSTIAVLFSAGGLVIVVSFFPQAVNKTTPASKQTYSFISYTNATLAELSADDSIRDYGLGDGEVVVVVVDSVVVAGLVVVVVNSVVVPLGLAAGVTVSVFCSHAASNAALARMQMYFFIG